MFRREMFQGDLVLDLIIEVITGDVGGSKKSIYSIVSCEHFPLP